MTINEKIIKELIKNKVPAVWATNPNIENAITSFMDAEPVGEDK